MEMWSGGWSDRSQQDVTEKGASRSKLSSWEGEKGQAEAKKVMSSEELGGSLGLLGAQSQEKPDIKADI